MTYSYGDTLQQAKEQEDLLKQKKFLSGVADSCDLGCVKGCAYQTWQPWNTCF